MKDNEEKVLEGGCLLAMIPVAIGNYLIIEPILRGWVLCKLWAWFVIPTFALPPLHVAVAIGLMVVVAMFKGFRSAPKTPSQTTGEVIASMGSSILISVVGPFLSLLTGRRRGMFEQNNGKAISTKRDGRSRSRFLATGIFGLWT